MTARLALGTRRVTGWGAVAGMATGFLFTVARKRSGLSDSVIYELVPAFPAAGLATLAGSALPRTRTADLRPAA